MGSGSVLFRRAAQGASRRAAAATAPPRPEGQPSLRLAVTRGVLGIELDLPFALGPLSITSLALAFPDARFPIDLSGGVARFRHRRGQLQNLVVEADPAAVAAWAAPKLRGLLAESAPEVRVSILEDGLAIGLHVAARSLAFDLLATPLDGDLRLVPDRARGLGLGAPPHAVALQAITAVIAPFGRVVRGAVLVRSAVEAVSRRVLPAAGGRAPSAVGVRWSSVTTRIDAGETGARLVLEASSDGPLPKLTARVLSTMELGDLAGAADDACAAGRLDEARALYLAALERAPRHPEIARRLAWIDVMTGRPDAALATLIEVVPAVSAGVLGATLLEAVGDADGAAVAYTRAAQAEPHGPSAGASWMGAARLATSARDRIEALDQAIARSPTLEAARWARLDAHLDLADTRAARADAQHLEAASQGAEAKLAVWRRSAELFLQRGHVAEAGVLFERALRYAPDDVKAIVGLARSLRETGEEARAVGLFARAVGIAERAHARDVDAELELGRALAEVAGDRPGAIARVRAIPGALPQSAEARFLEGRWRSEIGDTAGAAIAFGRARDAVELLAPQGERASAVAALLLEAASLEEQDRGDLAAAQRDLGLALRLCPHDGKIAARFRDVASRASRRAPPPPFVSTSVSISVPVPSPSPSPSPDPSRDRDPDPGLGSGSGADEEDEADDERLVQALTDQLRANPTDQGVAMELAGALERLGRDMDLLALLSARLDEGSAEERADVAPLRRAVLQRLATAAHAAGRTSEAELYEMMAAGD